MSYVKGREPTKEDRKRQGSAVVDKAMRAASRPTSQPRPAWMLNPENLPKSPPGVALRSGRRAGMSGPSALVMISGATASVPVESVGAEPPEREEQDWRLTGVGERFADSGRKP